MAARVSVCLPAYNADRYIESAVRSVLAQTFADFELLILDDGSTDRTLDVLERLAEKDRRIRVTTRANAGLITTLNELISMASGVYIARMDADDLCRPERFARQVAYLDEFPDCVAVGSRCLFIDPEGLPIVECVDKYSHEDIEELLLRTELAISHPSVMIRREALAQVGGAYRDAFPHAEDLDLFLRLGEIGRLCNLPEVLLEYRCHAASVSHRYTANQYESACRAVEAAMGRRGMTNHRKLMGTKSASVETRSQLHRKWAWWALGSGRLQTARKHAGLALASEPWNGPNWRLFATVLRDSLIARH